MSSFCDEYFGQACKEEDSLKRMVYMATYNAATYFLVKGRTAKPFNPLLGETYEFVTPTHRFFGEQVSHHPPVLSIHCQGSGWELTKSLLTSIKFNGKQVQCDDFNPTRVEIQPECMKG